jgi:hypothetical protein
MSVRRAAKRRAWRGRLCRDVPQPEAEKGAAQPPAEEAVSFDLLLLAALALPPLPLSLRERLAARWGVPHEVMVWLAFFPPVAMTLPRTPKARQRALAEAVSGAPLPAETAGALLETWVRLHADG